MGQLVRITDRFTSPQVALIQRMNPDCDPVEFDQFIHVAASLGLDPLKKQIYAFVFSKNDKDKRRMSIVVGIDGFRAVAKRSGNYRPDSNPPRWVIDPEKIDPDRNPLGLVSAEVTVYQYVHGDWWPVVGIAHWDEIAPMSEGGSWETGDNGKRYFKGNGKVQLDPKKDQWRRMPKLMLAKCAEAQAIRRGWPEDLSGVYSDEEMDRARTIDLTATEIAEAAAVEKRLELVGGKDGIMFDFGEGLERVELGKAADRIMEKFQAMQPHEILQWKNLNRAPMNEFWARKPTDALEIKKHIEKIEKSLDAQ